MPYLITYWFCIGLTAAFVLIFKESDARKLLRKRQGEIAIDRLIGPESERVTVSELAKRLLNDYRVNGRKSADKAQRMVKRYDDDGNEIDSG